MTEARDASRDTEAEPETPDPPAPDPPADSESAGDSGFYARAEETVDGNRSVSINSIASIFGAAPAPVKPTESSPSLEEELRRARRRLKQEPAPRVERSSRRLRERSSRKRLSRLGDESGIFEAQDEAGLFAPGISKVSYENILLGEGDDEVVEHTWGKPVEVRDRHRLQTGIFQHPEPADFPLAPEEEEETEPRGVTMRSASGIFEVLDDEALKEVLAEPKTARQQALVEAEAPAKADSKRGLIGLVLGLVLGASLLAFLITDADEGESGLAHRVRGSLSSAGLPARSGDEAAPIRGLAARTPGSPDASPRGEERRRVPLSVSFQPMSKEERQRVVGRLWAELVDAPRVYEVTTQLGELGREGLFDFIALLLESHVPWRILSRAMDVIANFEPEVERGALAELLRRAVPPLVQLVQERISGLEGPELYRQVCDGLVREPKALTRYQYQTLEQQARRFGCGPAVDLLGRHPKLELQMLRLILAVEPSLVTELITQRLELADKARTLELLALLQSCERPVLTERVHEILKSTADTDVLAAACRVLGRHRQARSVELLLGQLGSRRDPVTRRQIEAALIAIRDSDPDARGRPVAAWWAEVAPIWRGFDGEVETALDPDESPGARAAALQRLSRLRDPRSDQAIAELSLGGPALVRLAAIRAAGRRRLWQVVPSLVPLLEEPDTQLRWTAHAALRSITGRLLGSDRTSWEDFLKAEAQR